MNFENFYRANFGAAGLVDKGLFAPHIKALGADQTPSGKPVGKAFSSIGSNESLWNRKKSFL
jgi:hypothetical protein